MNKLICWYDGEYTQLGKVSVSPLAFGFIHADATYDVLRVKDGKIMFLDLHLNRYQNSCRYFDFIPVDNVITIAESLIAKNNIVDAFLWLTAWRGIPPSGSPRDITAPQHNLIYVKPYYGISPAGVTTCIDKRNRRTPDQVHNQEYKNFSWIEFNRAQRHAVTQGYDTSLLLSVDNYITEGPGFGVCFVKDGAVFTPAKDVLKSVTISVVEKLCKKLEIPFARVNITEDEAKDADECFICSTSGGVTPVTKLDSKEYTHNLTLVLKESYDRLR